jgi:hypothetical protein
MATGGLLSVVLCAKMAGNWQLINNISHQSTAQTIALCPLPMAHGSWLMFDICDSDRERVVESTG